MAMRMSSAVVFLAIAAIVFVLFAVERGGANPSCPIPATPVGNPVAGKALFEGANCQPNCTHTCAGCHGDPKDPCDPALWGSVCYQCPQDERGTTTYLNKALYGALPNTLPFFLQNNDEVMGPLNKSETMAMFQELGIDTPQALADVAAYLATLDRTYTIGGRIFFQNLSVPLDVEVCPGPAPVPALFPDPLNPNAVLYSALRKPGYYTVAPTPYGSDPPSRNLVVSFNVIYISDCFFPDCTPPQVCSTEIRPVDFHLSADVYCDAINGSDANDGSSWRSAKKSMKSAMDAARAGDEIWVAAGRYVENVTLKAGVALYGGFAGREGSREERNTALHPTIIDGQERGSVVTIEAGAPATTRIDGFTIEKGKALFNGGGIQILCGASSSPTIVNNTITKNRAGLSGGGIGVACGDVLRDAAIAPVIANNFIDGNRAGVSGGGVYTGGGSAIIMTNTISENRAEAGGGLYVHNGLIASNAILENRSGMAGGGGIYSASGSAEIFNNTLVGNSAAAGGAAGIAFSASSAMVVNNIVAFNSSGLRSASSTPSLRMNCVYGNRRFDYDGMRPGVGDIQADPRFAEVDRRTGIRLRAGSPCIDRGDDAAVRTGWRDIEGEARLQNAHVDIGADESHRSAQR